MALGPDGERHLFYRVDVNALPWSVKDRLADHIAWKFGVSRAEVFRDLDDPDHGLPILADDVVVTMDARLFL